MTSDTLAKMSRNSVGIGPSQRPDADHLPRDRSTSTVSRREKPMTITLPA